MDDLSPVHTSNNVEASSSNVRLCCQKGQQCRTSFALKFRPFDKVERCFDIVANVDRALESAAGLYTGLSTKTNAR